MFFLCDRIVLLFELLPVGDQRVVGEDDEADGRDDVADDLVAEEVGQLTGQDQAHDRGHDIGNAEAVELGEEGAVLAVVDLVEHDLRANLAADHQRHEHGTERHHDAFGPAVKEVQPAVVPAGDLRLEQVGGSEAVGAEAVGRNEDGNERDDDGDLEHDALALERLALLGRLVDEVSREDLHQGDGGGDGRDQDQQVEDHAEDAAEGAHVVEHVLQSREEQARAVELDLVHGRAYRRRR